METVLRDDLLFRGALESHRWRGKTNAPGTAQMILRASSRRNCK
jgi:hypothetical protein